MPPLISALMVTRPASLPRLAFAFADFAAQQYPARELVVVHDGDAAFDVALQALAREHAVSATIERAAAGLALGALRNRTLELARGELVAQWDDDDRQHPARLALQAAEMKGGQADFAFLTDQLHWFPATSTLYWEDWRSDPHPLDVVPGTLVGKRALMPRYPDARRGEDTTLLLAILAARRTIARIRDAGWSYIYTYHGANAWPEAHHTAIVVAKSLSPARLLAREAILRERLAQYVPPMPPVTLPYAGGAIAIGAHPAPSGRNRRAATA